MAVPNFASLRAALPTKGWPGIAATIATLCLLAGLAIVPASHGAEDDLQLYPLASSNFGRVLRVSGIANPGQAVRIEANGEVVARTIANESGDFAVAFTPVRGMNTVQAVEDGRFHPARSAAFRVRQDMPRILERPVAVSRPATISGASTRSIVMKVTLAAPVITTPPATTTANPVTLSGTAPASSTVNFYVNGRYTRAVTATAGGTFSTWVPLEDSLNSVYAVATSGPDTSPASNTVQTTYTNSIPRTYAAGTISVPTVWTAGSAPTYTINGTQTISNTGALWIQPGVTVSVTGNYKLSTNGGEIAIRGTSTQHVILRPVTGLCTETTVRRIDWTGMEATGTTGRLSTEYADVLCADKAFFFNGGTGSVRNSRALSGSYAVQTVAANAASMIVPLISGGNEFRGNTAGVRIEKNSSPVVSGGNTITGNTFGIDVVGNSDVSQNPMPTISGNAIYGNSTSNYRARTFGSPDTTVLDATGNWWGSPDPTVIASTISDHKDFSTAPYVNYAGFLDGSGGNPVPVGNTIIGPVTTTSTLPAGDYLALNDINIATGVTWTLLPGTTIRMTPGRSVFVSGNLSAAGSASQRVHFTSASQFPIKGDTNTIWGGIQIQGGATASLDRVRVEYADNGISFNAGQGVVTRSLVRFCNTGIYVGAGSNPTINLGNEISRNDYGIQVRGNSTAASNPQPVVNGNSLFANATYNYYTLGFATPKPTLDATGNWWGVTTVAAVVATIYTAGTSSTTVNSNGFLLAEPQPPAMFLTGFAMSAQHVKPLITADLAQGVFTINRSGSVTYRVVRDSDASVVRTWSQAYAAPGQYGFTWDGKDDLGAAVNGGLYRVVVTATDGLDPYVYDVAMPTTTLVPSGALTAGFNPYLNQFYKVQLTYSQPSLGAFTITPQGGQPFYLFQGRYFPTGTSWIYWDGRDNGGTLLQAPSTSFATDATLMRANGVFVFTPMVTITGTGNAPNIEVKSDPYLIAHSLDQVSSIVYRIDADAVVRVTMLPPGVSDPASASAIVLVDNQTQSARDGSGNPVDHTVVWRGFSDSDPNGILVANDGAYTFAIEATLPATGQKSVYRGVLNIVQ